jgi:hypothetical protein
LGVGDILVDFLVLTDWCLWFVGVGESFVVVS